MKERVFLCFCHYLLPMVVIPRFYTSQIYNHQKQATSHNFWMWPTSLKELEFEMIWNRKPIVILCARSSSYLDKNIIFKLEDKCINLVDESEPTLFFKVAQNSFQHFPRRRFWWVVITTLYQLMLQSWYQKTAESLVNTLVLFSWHNRLP